MTSNGLKQRSFRKETLAVKSVKAGSQLWQEERDLLSRMRGVWPGCGRHTREKCCALGRLIAFSPRPFLCSPNGLCAGHSLSGAPDPLRSREGGAWAPVGCRVGLGGGGVPGAAGKVESQRVTPVGGRTAGGWATTPPRAGVCSPLVLGPWGARQAPQQVRRRAGVQTRGRLIPEPS